MNNTIFLLFLSLSLIFLPSYSNLLQTNTKLSKQVVSFLNNKQKVSDANDAISSVLSLLEDLKGSNQDEQNRADIKFSNQENNYTITINDLTKVKEENEKNFIQTKNDLFSIQEKINDTKYAMDWINSRIKTNNEKIEKLAGQRCESNSLFIDNLREKQEALEVLAWLKKDLEELKAKGVLFLEEDEIKDFTTKLNGYSKIYEQKALKDFEKLAKNDENHFSLLETKEKNKQETLKDILPNALTTHILDIVEDLIKHLSDSITELEKLEIQGSRDYANFKSKTNLESNLLKEELNKKSVYLGKLEIDEEVASGAKNKAAETLKKSEDLLNNNVEEFEDIKKFYKVEKERRNDENTVIGEIINIYKEKVNSAHDFLKSKVNDYVEDEKFDKTSEKSKKKKLDDLLNEKGHIKDIVKEEAEKRIHLDEDFDLKTYP